MELQQIINDKEIFIDSNKRITLDIVFTIRR
jgi:hypothetical protein